MISAVLILGATGLILFLSGLPVARNDELGHRTEPFVEGIGRRVGPFSLIPSSRNDSPIARVVARLVPDRDEDLAQRLHRAGSSMSPDVFRVEQVTWAAAGILLVALVGMLTLSTGLEIDPRSLPVLALIAAASGFLGRDWQLSRQVRVRADRLNEELPTAVDLLTLAVMSGESIPAAFSRVGRILGQGIGREFQDAVGEMRAGGSTVEALESLSQRIGDPVMARVVDALVTALSKGAPVADVLRSMADDSRENRRRRLLELGGRREVLMLIPVVFLIMPVVVLFALLPGLVSLDLLVP